MGLICVKLADKCHLKKIIFQYTGMSDSLMGAFTHGFYIGRVLLGLLSAVVWANKKICHQEKQIEELSSQHEDSDELCEACRLKAN